MQTTTDIKGNTWTDQQAAILTAVAGGGSVTVDALAATFGKKPSAMRKAVARLVARGALVEDAGVLRIGDDFAYLAGGAREGLGAETGEEGTTTRPNSARASRGGVKPTLAAIFDEGALLTKDQLISELSRRQGREVSWVTVVTAMADLRNPKYCGGCGVRSIVRDKATGLYSSVPV